jgi:hypothetical protein
VNTTPTPENHFIVIGTEEGDHVSLQVGRWLDDWCGAVIEVHCQVWRGKFSGSFYKGELSIFAKEINQLYKTLFGVASLNPIDTHLKLYIVGNGRGQVTVDGTAAQSPGSDTFLTFHFEIDQTYLQRILAGLSKADPD